jgi:hypothetical protein
MWEANIFIKLNTLQKLTVIYKLHHLIVNIVLFQKTASECQVIEYKNTKLLRLIESEKSERMVSIKKERKCMIYESGSLERISFHFCTVIKQHTFHEWRTKIFMDAQGG